MLGRADNTGLIVGRDLKHKPSAVDLDKLAFRADRHAEGNLKRGADADQRVPLVLHGASSVPQEAVAAVNAHGGNVAGTSGVPEDLLRRAAASATPPDTPVRMPAPV